ncbi:MAG: helix-turn-helix domain-containing protein [Oscillospiraceae bacterium]|nr:helix-turn-helix domain-containing protein [Oscillospiraceae bacterium]
MSNRLFQRIVHQMRESIDRVIGVVDDGATVIACSDLAKIGETFEYLSLTPGEGAVPFVRDNYTFKPFGSTARPEFGVFVEGTDEIASQFCKILSISFASVKQYYDEKYDRSNFIRNVILDNILPGDIYVKARELHFNVDASRVALLIRIVSSSDISAFDVIQNLFPDKQKDFVFNINETDLVLVKEIKPGIEPRDLEKLARSIVDTLGSEFYTKVVIGIGTAVVGVKDLAKSFKESQVALEVGKVFDTDKAIISYDNLGIARLIYQLPTTLCDMFLREVFKKGSIESLDHETLFTIQKFFENNLNVSETSRKLFVHRNTLVYRLEKIRKLTGLDLREFDHAIVFKVALMVKKYMVTNPVKY